MKKEVKKNSDSQKMKSNDSGEGGAISISSVDKLENFVVEQLRLLNSAANIKGGIDLIKDGKIWGWAADGENLEASLEVEIRIDGILAGLCLANIKREDLVVAGYGSGNHGFLFDIPHGFRDDKVHKVQCYANGRPLHILDTYKAGIKISGKPDIRGSIDYVDENNVWGWGCNISDLDKPVIVEIYFDENIIGETVANLQRNDVAEAGFGTANCGFHFRIPEALKDGQKHKVTCLAEGFLLSANKEFIICSDCSEKTHAVDINGYVDVVTSDLVWGWACSGKKNNEPLKIELKIDGNIAGIATTSIYREDVALAGMGSGENGFQFLIPEKYKDGKKHRIECSVIDYLIPMPEEFKAGIILKKSAKQLIPKNGPKCVINLLSGQSGMPDYFSMKAAEFRANSLVIAFATDQESWIDAQNLVSRNSLSNYDFLLISRISNNLEESTINFSGCVNFFAAEYGDAISDLAVFHHVLFSSAVSEYDSTVLLNCGQINSKDENTVIEFNDKKTICAINALRGIGVVSSEVKQSKYFIDEKVRKFLNTVLPRQGSKLDTACFDIGSGKKKFIHPIILKQIIALRLSVNDFLGGDKLSECKWLDKFDSLCGFLASEGCMSIVQADLNFRIQASDANLMSVYSESIKEQRKFKTIAFMLPQFHPVVENDRWWGKGFTEWNNVVRGKPFFRFHNQPRLPKDLGFYDLRHPDTQNRQAELAGKHGIYGFCYYYYWFDGKKMLNEPIEQMLKSGAPDFPFCVCWANENWSRNWDGQDKFVLLKQDYSMDGCKQLIGEFIEMMKDPRYIRHENRPVLLVYRIRVIPNWLSVAKMWRDECRKAGLGEIHLCAVRFGLEPLDGSPEVFGLDSYVLFPPHETRREDLKSKVLDLNSGFNGEIFGYDAVIDGDLERFDSSYPWPVHRGAMLGWDNTARRMGDARVFHGATPLKFRHWLKGIFDQENKNNTNKNSLLFINAWNEWAEGSTLEPDQKFGDSYLRAVSDVLGAYSEKYEKNNILGDFKASKSEEKYFPLFNPTATEGRGNKITKHGGRINFRDGVSTIMICAHVSGHQLYGGERSFLDVVTTLSSLGYNLIACLPSANNKDYIKSLRDLCCEVITFSYVQWFGQRDFDNYVALNFMDIICQYNVDIVYANTIVLLEPLLAAKKLNVISVVHARELISLDTPLQRRLDMSAEEIVGDVFKKSDYIIANSKCTFDLYRRTGRTFCVPNAVRVEDFDFENVVAGPVNFGIVSSNIPKKGVADFLEIARAVQDRCPEAIFTVIGPDNIYIENWKKDKSTPKNIRFAGYMESPADAMRQLNVLLSLSNFAESFGRTIAEAMAASRPVIAYEWGATSELVENNVTGFLVPYRDVESAVRAVVKLCKETELIRIMGAKSRERIKELYSYQALKRNLGEAFSVIGKGADQINSRLTSCSKGSSGEIGLTVIIPIYNAFEEVFGCLMSLEKHTSKTVRKILINDCSSDPRISELLSSYLDKDDFQIIINEKNIGYTKSINLGIRAAAQDDVILLNSDAVVTPNWIAGLRSVAFMATNVGTVTAMSDNAGAFSFPLEGKKNEVPSNFSRDDFAIKVVQATRNCSPVEVPTGSGFCMYIKRQLIDDIGYFDEAAFPRGYGEENDFCMRALKSNWINMITPWAYVYHVRSASFKSDKDALIKLGVDVVTKRYPDYASLVRAAFRSESMMSLRAAAKIY